MLGVLVQCAACSFNLELRKDLEFFPLCSNCASSFISCPPLCRHCSSPLCSPPSCLRPWATSPSIHSYSGRYLLLGNSYTVLKKWKIRRGTLFDRQVLKTTPKLISQWQSFSAECVIPIPQHFHRAWRMKGSPAEIISQWVAFQLNLPVLRAIELSSEPLQRQAELNLVQRLQNKNRFRIDRQSLRKIKRVILVDDFMTTGRTLKQASYALLHAGVEEVHTFCLGVKVLRLYTERSSDLL